MGEEWNQLIDSETDERQNPITNTNRASMVTTQCHFKFMQK